MGILRTDKISGLETPTAVTGSVVFDGTGDYLSLADSNDFTLAKNDFTFECWLYATGDVTNKRFFGQINSGGSDSAVSIRMGFNSTDLLIASVYESTTEKAITAGFIAEDRWYHIAFVRDGSTLRSFVDGVQQGTLSFTGSVNDSSNQMAIGRLGEYDGSYFTGYISNLRFINGTALYTSDFTPPTHELEVIGDTVLLCCNNSDSAGAEGTGKTITVNGNAAASTFSPGLTRDFTSGTEFKGVTTFDTQGYFVPPSGTTEQRGRGRGIFSVGSGTPASTGSKNIEYVQISSSGNGIDFGDLSEGSQSQGAVSSTTRSVISLGDPVPAAQTNILEFITIATTGDSVNFGDLTTKRSRVSGVASQTRGVYIGGTNELVSPYGGSTVSYTDTMDYITIASLGNAISFGETDVVAAHGGSVCNSTRGVIANNFNGSSATNTMEYITIATTGDAKDFGDLTRAETYLFRGCSGSNSTRGIFGGGYNGGLKNIIDYITITSTGNAIDFGDLTLATRSGSTTSNSIRTMFFGGYNASNGGRMNIISYVNIMSTGNAQEFGDCKEKGLEGSGSSDSHGGLS